jgi:succinate dehydrogenase / fumarate reductase, cytochrome b subunit
MSVANRPPDRPLSPHLQVYRPQLTSMLSILHRATGIALSVGALYLAVWVIAASATSPRAYALFSSFNMSILGRIVLGGWLFSAYYHLCNGIRHLFWDAGYGFELKDAYRSGWIVVGVSLVATLVSWIVGLRLV